MNLHRGYGQGLTYSILYGHLQSKGMLYIIDPKNLYTVLETDTTYYKFTEDPGSLTIIGRAYIHSHEALMRACINRLRRGHVVYCPVIFDKGNIMSTTSYRIL